MKNQMRDVSDAVLKNAQSGEPMTMGEAATLLALTTPK
jgi:hypothetical protein